MDAITTVCNHYIEALKEADPLKAKSLFEKGAKVKTPIFGQLDSDTFFDEVKFDTIQAEISDVHIYQNKEEMRAALHYKFNWTIKNGAELMLELVNVLEFNHDHKIIAMNVIYDTVDARPAFKAHYV